MWAVPMFFNCHWIFFSFVSNDPNTKFLVFYQQSYNIPCPMLITTTTIYKKASLLNVTWLPMSSLDGNWNFVFSTHATKNSLTTPHHQRYVCGINESDYRTVLLIPNQDNCSFIFKESFVTPKYLVRYLFLTFWLRICNGEQQHKWTSNLFGSKIGTQRYSPRIVCMSHSHTAKQFIRGSSTGFT